MQCPDKLTLLRHVSDGTDDASRADLRAHVASCPSCQSLIDAWTSNLSSAQAGDTLPRQEEPLARGTNVGRYVVLHRVGQGGMGVVYAAYDPELDRKIALKLIRAELTSSAKAEALRGRLLREAQAMARVAHPNVVHVYDVAVWNEQIVVAMEFVAGETVGHWLRERRDWRQVLTIFVAAGRGLAAAHAAGLVHRDFKPDNVLLGRDGRPLVTDFGLARPLDAVELRDEDSPPSPTSPLHERLTHTGALMGTPAYMAPEQMFGEPSDARTDVFGFCVALYEALYGERPFSASRLPELAAQIATGPPAKAPASSQVPPRLRATLLRGLRADPKARFDSMEALLAELTWDPGDRGRVWLRRTAALLLLLAVPAGWWLVRHGERQSCQGGARKLVGVWDAARKQQVRAAFFATHASFAGTTYRSVARELDRFAAEWLAMHVEACEATRVRGEQSAELLDLRMQCLDEKRRALAATSELFSRADAQIVAQAVQATTGLGGLEPCADAAALRAPVRLPADPAIQRRVDAERERLAAVRALLDAGKYDDANARVPERVQAARAIGYQPLEAEALLLRGRIESKRTDRAAQQSLTEAVIAAESSRDERVATEAWTELVWVQSRVTERTAEAHDSARHAEAYLARLGEDERLRANLHYNVGFLYESEGKLDDARRETERALADARRAYGEEHPMVASCLGQLGYLMSGDNDLAPAEAAIRRSLGINEKVLGAEHPETGASLVLLAGLQVTEHEDDAAVATYGRALAILEKAYGPEDPHVAFALIRLADELGGRGQPGDFERAVAAGQRALAIWRLRSAKSSQVASTLALLASVYASHGDYQTALGHFDQALAIAEPDMGRTNPYVAWMIIGQRAHALYSLRRYDAAIADFEEALRSKLQPESFANLRFGLAQSLWEAGRSRPRAVTLARQARDYWAGAGARFKDNVAESDRWLARHPAAVD
jgi:tetratricopeptide (TPR) repeat protein